MSMTPHVCRCGTCFREMNGAVAQLGERLNGIQEVRGSTPRSSTNISAWDEEMQVSDEMTEDGLTGRALELADLVSDMIWGGERGWERADNEQFKHLKRKARERMKNS
jgi:hypothetical protein